MTTEMVLLKLQSDLTRFGLNPAEWSLKKVTSSHYQVSHTTEEDFSFLGYLETQNSVLTWKKLELFSI